MPNWCANRLRVTGLAENVSHVRALMEGNERPLYTRAEAEGIQLFLAGCAGLLRPVTPCVAHIWLADDFEDIDPELTPGEVTAAIELADWALDADISLSWGYMHDCAESVKARRETE